jgi:hypothetical protein
MKNVAKEKRRREKSINFPCYIHGPTHNYMYSAEKRREEKHAGAERHEKKTTTTSYSRTHPHTHPLSSSSPRFLSLFDLIFFLSFPGEASITGFDLFL